LLYRGHSIAPKTLWAMFRCSPTRGHGPQNLLCRTLPPPPPRHPSRPDHHLPCLLWRHWRLVATGISVGRSLQHLDTYPCYRLLRSTIRIAEVFRSGGLSRQRTRSARWLPLPRRGDGKRPLWTKSILSHPPAADILALLLPRVLSPLP